MLCVDVYRLEFEIESAKENLLQTILDNRENLDSHSIGEAIKDYVRNHEKYNLEKKKMLELISNEHYEINHAITDSNFV